MGQYKVYEPGQRAVYEEDGARAIVEVIDRVVKDDVERYKLKVISPLNASQPIFVGAEDTVSAANEAGLDFVRGFKIEQELNVDRNLTLGYAGTGMWSLTDIVNQ